MGHYTYPLAGNQTITTATNATCTLTVPTNTYEATLFATTSMNFWLDGTAPTTGALGTGTGFPLMAGDVLHLTADEARGFKGIAQSGAGKLIVAYVRV